MLNLLFLALCLSAGILLRQTGIVPPGGHKGINAWVLYVALPAVSLQFIPAINWQPGLLLPVLSPIVIWGGSWFFFNTAARLGGYSKPVKGALILNSGLSNTAFLGFTALYFSEKDLPLAVVYDQVTFALLATIGVVAAVRHAGSGYITYETVFKRLLRFPPFVAGIAALVLPLFIDISFFNPLFKKITQTISPMVLFSIGLQMRPSAWKKYKACLGLGLLYKLLFAPLIIAAVAWLLHIKGVVAAICIFQAAMPTLGSAGVLADQTGLEPDLSNLVIGFSAIISLGTMAIWGHLLTS